jgi:hypothetical protein
LGRISGNPRVEKTLMKLIDDPDVRVPSHGRNQAAPRPGESCGAARALDCASRSTSAPSSPRTSEASTEGDDQIARFTRSSGNATRTVLTRLNAGVHRDTVLRGRYLMPDGNRQQGNADDPN